MNRWIVLPTAVGLALALATQTGAMGYNLTLAALVLAAGALAAVAIQVRRPMFGMGALVLSATALPLHIAAEGQVHAPLGLAALVCACFLARELLIRRRFELVASPVVGVSIALMASAILSFFAGQIDWYGIPGAAARAQVGGLLMFLLSGGLLLAFAHQIREVDELKKLTYLFLAAGSIVPFLMLSPKLDIIAAPTVHPTTIGSIFWIWLVGMGTAQALFNRTLSPIARFGLMIVVLTSLLHFLVQQRDWVSGWAPPLVAFGIVAAFKFPRTVLCGSLAALPGVYMVVHKVIQSLMVEESYSLVTRLAAWKTVGKIVETSPIFGVGPSNYYHYAQLYSTYGWYVKLSSHNNYIDIAAQTGLVGLALFFGLGLAALLLLLGLNKEVTGNFEQAYVIGCLGCVPASMASGMLADWVIPFVYNIGLQGFRSSLLFWVFVGGSVALWRLQRAEYEAPEPEAEGFEALPSPALFESGYGPLELDPPH